MDAEGKSVGYDQYNNKIFIDCNIFSTDQLVTFIVTALEEFNAIPHFTSFTFDDTEIITNFYSIFVQGAVIQALMSKALIEKGREIALQDNGVSVTFSSVADMLVNQANTEMTNFTDKVTRIKASMKPRGLSLGVMSLTSGGRFPIVNAMRMRREGNIF